MKRMRWLAWIITGAAVVSTGAVSTPASADSNPDSAPLSSRILGEAGGVQSSGSRPENAGVLYGTVTGNWDGLGGDGVGVVYNIGGDLWWYLDNSPTGGGYDYLFKFGVDGDVPVVGNWDGAGGDGVGAVRAGGDKKGYWYVRNGVSGDGCGSCYPTFQFGLVGDRMVAGNWDGVGGDGPGAVRVGADKKTYWYVRNGVSGDGCGSCYPTFQFGLATDIPVVGNWDGVGGDGPGEFRAGNWYVRNGVSGGGCGSCYPTFHFGADGDWVTPGNWDGIGGDGPGVSREPRPLHWFTRNGVSGDDNPSASFVYDPLV